MILHLVQVIHPAPRPALPRNDRAVCECAIEARRVLVCSEIVHREQPHCEQFSTELNENCFKKAQGEQKEEGGVRVARPSYLG